jgi:hypothetical protein
VRDALTYCDHEKLASNLRAAYRLILLFDPGRAFFRPDRISAEPLCERRSRMAAAFGGHRFSGARRP